jgi:hypothetical protein
MREHIGYGVFTWGSPERQTGRYGFVYPDKSDFEDTMSLEPRLDVKACRRLQDKHVKLICVVRETRPSGHAGDRFLRIFPNKLPLVTVGEEVMVGIGNFFATNCDWAPHKIQIGLKPTIDRDENWLDARILYRLHDQTVDFYVEETDEPDHPDPQLKPEREEGAIGNGDGTLQIRTKRPLTEVRLNRIENLGGGVFSVTPPSGKEDEFQELQ